MNEPAVYVVAVGTDLPGPPISNADLGKRFGGTGVWEQWAQTYIGTHHRHLARDLDTGEVRYTLADMCSAAAGRALAAAGVTPGEVDLVVLGTSSPDLLMPATVNVVADRVGIDGVPTYQLQSGCTGAVQALDVAHKMLLSGRYRTALVLGADSCAKHLDVHTDPSKLRPAEQVNGMLFGDGAGAAVLRTEPAPGAAHLRHVELRLVGAGREPGQVVAWFGAGDGPPTAPVVEDYKAIEDQVPAMAAGTVRRMVDALDWADGDVDYLLPPQLSGRMTARIVEAMAVAGAQEISCVAELGNTGNAVPFFQLERLLPRMAPGDRAVGVAIESSKWIEAGFALEAV
ncbi:3-oxoacyl-ACP synthase III family protein [Dactylosporangium sp. CA-233914]|uniref:3-oxoacyl-ACP synthase III family protein n=1 Tax=Dactylosporangium sp. CA-233914 TaxID=3239934 RepID=UPI003D919BB2